MKKKYNTPVTMVISLRTVTFLAVSPTNEYSNDQGRIRFSSSEVDAGEAD